MRIMTLLALAAIGCGGVQATSLDLGGGGNQANGGGALVTLKNASIRDLQNGSYNLTFVLVDSVYASGRSIQRVDLLRWSWGNDKVTTAIGCDSAPWNQASPETGAITVTAAWGASSIEFYYECAGYGAQPQSGNSAIGSKPSGTVHVAFDGILRDATPFTAEADVPVL